MTPPPTKGTTRVQPDLRLASALKQKEIGGQQRGHPATSATSAPATSAPAANVDLRPASVLKRKKIGGKQRDHLATSWVPKLLPNPNGKGYISDANDGIIYRFGRTRSSQLSAILASYPPDQPARPTPVPLSSLNARQRANRKRLQTQNKARKDTERNQKREHAKLALDKAGFSAWGEKENVSVIYRRRRQDLHDEMEDKAYPYDHPIFQGFKRIGGRGSGTIYVLDEDTKELVFAVKITETKDMTERDKEIYGTVFDYFQHDLVQHYGVKRNGAMVNGYMVASGWRKSQDKMEEFGTYCAKGGMARWDEWYAHTERAAHIHQLYAERFADLAPALYENQVEERAGYQVPAFGFDLDDDLDEYVWCSNLVHTRDGFENCGHADEDASTYTFGMSGNVFKDTSRIASFEDGYAQEGGFFYVADYSIIIDYSLIDGVCDQVWQGPKNIHATVRGVYKEGFTRLGSSGQINNGLKEAVKNYLMKPGQDGKYIMNDWNRFKAGREKTKQKSEEKMRKKAEAKAEAEAEMEKRNIDS